MNTVKQPVVVAYGMGVDSTAMLVGMQQRGERPDLILWADTGDEKPQTYAYLPIINEWLARVGFPLVTVVKNPSPKTHDLSLSDRCLRNGVLPSMAYGGHTCSLVWKIEPQQAWIKRWAPAIECWASGQDVITCVGYDNGGADAKRCGKAMGKKFAGYTNRYPLIEWKWDREECIRQIVAAGLPSPGKSACFHCPSMKKHEIVELARVHPILFAKALRMEVNAEAYHAKRAAETGKKGTQGLGRNFAWSSVAIAA